MEFSAVGGTQSLPRPTARSTLVLGCTNILVRSCTMSNCSWLLSHIDWVLTTHVFLLTLDLANSAVNSCILIAAEGALNFPGSSETLQILKQYLGKFYSIPAGEIQVSRS